MGVLAAAAVAVTGQAPQTGLSFTTEQASAGRDAYTRSCAVCHLASLQGSFEAPPLAGADFLNTWGDRATPDLLTAMRTMPPTAPGSLADDVYLNIVAFLLQANGATPGRQALTSTTNARLGSLGLRPAQASAPAAGASAAPSTPSTATPQRPAAAADADGARAPSLRGRTGVTAAGTIEGFVPVSEAMLRNPPQDDWLMVRGGYKAWSYSPLASITPATVGDLELVWSWGMNDGSNQPAPLAHGGVIYLINPGNIVQALDGQSGDLLWEYRAGPEQGGPMRNLALYNDKVYVATTDARLVALNARTGQRVWDVEIAPRAKGYSNSSGPLIADGKVIVGLGGCVRFGADGCYISAYDPETGARQWKFDTIARPGEPGGDTWGAHAGQPARGRRDLDYRQLRSGPESDYWGIAQAKPWVPASRGMTRSTRALHELDGGPPHQRRYARLALPAHSRRSARYGRGLRARAGRRRRPEAVFTIGKPGILWKLDRETGEFLGYKETIFQNIFDRIDPKTGAPTYRGDIAEAKVGEWVTACPGTEGGHNWQAMSYNPGAGLLDHSPQPELPRNIGTESRVQGRIRRHFGATAAGSRCPAQRQHREARRLRREDDAAGVEPRTASGLADGRAIDGRRARLRGRPRSQLPRGRRENRRDRVADPAWNLGAGIPVSFAIGGKQYIAVSTGLGGGSPRQVPGLDRRKSRYRALATRCTSSSCQIGVRHGF